MNAPHTHGPWITGPGRNNTIAVITLERAETRLVASVPANGRSGEEASANADLIAAAPDLLAVCEEIAGDSRCDLWSSERRMRLYHAIRKAKGE